jgi:hypothetical protein
MQIEMYEEVSEGFSLYQVLGISPVEKGSWTDG